MRFYLPLPDTQPGGTVVIRTRAGDAAALAARVKAALPPTPRPTIDVAADRLARVLRPWRTATALFVMLGVTALTLACLGIYSIMSYTASERVHELGIRVALGASPAQVIALAVREIVPPVALGVAAGCGLALVLARVAGSLLYGVAPSDPVTFVGAPLALGFIAFVAAWLPARRASRIDPAQVLRQE